MCSHHELKLWKPYVISPEVFFKAFFFFLSWYILCDKINNKNKAWVPFNNIWYTKEVSFLSKMDHILEGKGLDHGTKPPLPPPPPVNAVWSWWNCIYQGFKDMYKETKSYFNLWPTADKCLVNFRKVPYCWPSRVAVPCIFAWGELVAINQL